MTDVIHDPRTDWCACEPNGADRCEYRMLADAVIEHLDPRDGDEAEVALCITAVEDAAATLKAVREGTAGIIDRLEEAVIAASIAAQLTGVRQQPVGISQDDALRILAALRKAAGEAEQ